MPSLNLAQEDYKLSVEFIRRKVSNYISARCKWSLLDCKELGYFWVFGREQKPKEPDIGCAGGMRADEMLLWGAEMVEREWQERTIAQQQAEQERQERTIAQQQAEQERQERTIAQHQAEQQRERAEQERDRSSILAAQLRAAGIEPEA